jgi:hypothetical protein
MQNPAGHTDTMLKVVFAYSIRKVERSLIMNRIPREKSAPEMEDIMVVVFCHAHKHANSTNS